MVRIHFPVYKLDSPIREHSIDMDMTHLPREGESVYLEHEFTILGKTVKIKHVYSVTRARHCILPGTVTYMIWMA